MELLAVSFRSFDHAVKRFAGFRGSRWVIEELDLSVDDKTDCSRALRRYCLGQNSRFRHSYSNCSPCPWWFSYGFFILT